MKHKPMVNHQIFPSATDSAINIFTNAEHYCYVPVTPSGFLNIFFCGSGAQPSGATAFLEASQERHHTIGLMYPNSPYPDQPNCNNVPNPKDTYLDLFCQEVFSGENLTPLTSIDPPNSIHNRITKLLQYLIVQFPTEGWEQFIEEDEIMWTKIIVSGHSQGGDHAAFIGKYFPVWKIICLSSPREICKYITTWGTLPIEKYYFFTHLTDNFTKQDQTIRNMGITGAFVDTNIITDPAFWGQYLVSSILNPSPNDHKCTINDMRLKPVWEYLLN
jgi:hypothetical protein